MLKQKHEALVHLVLSELFFIAPVKKTDRSSPFLQNKQASAQRRNQRAAAGSVGALVHTHVLWGEEKE